MHLLERAHVLHRAWRYRLRSERREIAYLLSRNLAGATVIDVGANRGIYSYWMHRLVGPAGRVIAFEPQPELFEYLHDLKRTFKLDRLTIENAGLSNQIGEATLTRPENHWGGATLEHREQAVNGERMTIALTTLDAYLGEHPDLRPVKFIKCDIEGHELACFEGARQVLSVDGPELLFESHGKRIERIAELLTGLGYKGFFFFGNELVPIEAMESLKSRVAEPYLNYVFKTG